MIFIWNIIYKMYLSSYVKNNRNSIIGA